MSRRSFSLAIGAAVLLAAEAGSVYANGTAADDSITRAYNWGVLFLMAMPYVVAGSIAGWIVYSYRRAREKTGRAKK